MKLIEAIIIIGSMWSFVLFFMIYIFYWFKKNNILITVAEFEDNVIKYKSFRGRESKNYYYGFKDFFSRKPFDIKVKDCKDFYITAESIPIIGIKKILNLKKIETEINKPKEYIPYFVYDEDNENVFINENIIAWVNEARSDLYKSTELKLSTKDQILRLIVPIGIILLAISCLIFFPKIYESVMQTGNAVANNALTGFTQKLTEFIPKG